MIDEDLKLVAAAQAGDSQAFGRLYDAYGEKIYAFFLSRTRHVATAEDLTSTTFFKALAGLSKFRQGPDASFSGWLYRIAHHVLTDHWRSSKTHEELDTVEAMGSTDDTAAHAEAELQRAETERMLATLSDKDREIVRLRLWDERSFKEIGMIVGKSEAACKMTYGRAIGRLQQQYGET